MRYSVLFFLLALLSLLAVLRIARVFSFSAAYCSFHEWTLLGWGIWSKTSRDQLTEVFGTPSPIQDLGERPDPSAPLTILLYYREFPEAPTFKRIHTGEFAQMGATSAKVWVGLSSS